MLGPWLQVLHLLAIARSAGVELELDDFQANSDRTPFLADLKPSGRFVMEDVHKVRKKHVIIHFDICVGQDIRSAAGFEAERQALKVKKLCSWQGRKRRKRKGS